MDTMLLSALLLVSALPAIGAGLYVRKQVSIWVLQSGTQRSFVGRALLCYALVTILLTVVVYAVSIPGIVGIVSLLDEGSQQGASMVLGLGFFILYPVCVVINFLLGTIVVGFKTRRAWKYRKNGEVLLPSVSGTSSLKTNTQRLGQGVVLLLALVFSYEIFAPAAYVFGPEVMNFFRSTALACDNLPKGQQRPNPFDECIIKKAANANNPLVCEQLAEANKTWYDSESAVNYARCKAPFIDDNVTERQNLCEHVFSKYEGHNLQIVEPFVRDFGCDMDAFNNLDPWARQS